MKRLITSFFLLLAMILLVPTEGKAWGTLSLRSSVWGNWSDIGNNHDFEKVDDTSNHWKKEISGSDLGTGDYYFRIYVGSPNDSKGNLRPKSNNKELTNNVADTDCNFDTSNNYAWLIKQSVAKYSKITIYADYVENGGSWRWEVKFVGESGAASTPTNLVFNSDYTGWDDNKTMTSSNANKTWTYPLDVSSKPKQDVWFRFIDTNNENNSIVTPDGNGVNVPVNNATGILAEMKKSDNNHNFMFKANGEYTKYEVKVTLESDNKWYVYVKGTEKAPEFTITSNGYTAKGSISNGKYNFGLPASCYNKETGVISFSIAKKLDGTTTYLTSTDLVFDNHNNNEISGVTDNATGVVNFTYTTAVGTDKEKDAPNGDISVVYDLTTGKLTLSYESVQDVIGYSYYLIVPDENVGNTGRAVAGIAPAGHKAFRLVPGRERNDTKLNNDLTTLTLKIDGNKGRQLRYDSDDKIRFYIQNGEGTLFLQPNDNDADREIKQTEASNNGVDGYGIRVKNMESAKTNEYYIIKKGDAADATHGDTKSLTFMFSKNNGYHSYHPNEGQTASTEHGNAIKGFAKNGNLIVGFLKSRGYNTTYYNTYINGKDIYLVGDIEKDEYENTTNYPMTKVLWKDGVPRTDITEAAADSIVYEREVRKGTRSWDNFFLSFATTGQLNSWDLILRPHVQDQMDGQALEGGIFYAGSNNQGQALNPLLTAAQKARYASYRVFFNATYSTYRIEFYDNFCIGGPAVNGVEGSNVNNGEYFDADHRHGMKEETINGVKHYRYRGEFKQGSTFAFFVNPETSVNNYSENADFAAVNNNKKDDDNYNGMWETQAPVNESGVATKADYPFHNTVRYNTNGGTDNQSLGTGNNGILWTLPSGTYTVRFYYHEGIDKANANALYTVDKEVELKNATSTYVNGSGADETDNLGGLRTFSDDCALWLPAGVQAYYVPEINNGRAVLREVKDGIIPAHCAALIYDRHQLEGANTIHLYPVPTKYTDKLDASETNLLVDCYKESKTLQPIETVGDKTMYNYYMTNQYFLTDDLNDRTSRPVPLNFWRTRPGSTAKKNYTYLSVDSNIFPVSYVGDKNYEYENSRENIINDARSYCFILSIGNVDDNNVVTGITSVETEDNKAENNVWYTIQGIKVGAPVMPGLYIHNGKKVIIK